MLRKKEVKIIKPFLLKFKLNKFFPFLFLFVIGLTTVLSYFLSHQLTAQKTPVFHKVVHVLDGDTIEVDLNGQIERIRLIGIDAPEIAHLEKEAECFGDEATQKAKELLADENVFLVSDPLCSDKDQYDRLLRYVYLEDGTLINQFLIEEGYALNYAYKPFQLMEQFDSLEKQAKQVHLGLWGKCDF